MEEGDVPVLVTVETIEAMQAEIAFQGDSIEQLNAALADQQRDILSLREQLNLLAQQFRDLRESATPATDSSVVERPPHY